MKLNERKCKNVTSKICVCPKEKIVKFTLYAVDFSSAREIHAQEECLGGVPQKLVGLHNVE